MTERIATGGMLAALAVALNHALALVPNVELTSLTVFLGGWVLGPRLGLAVGMTAAVGLSVFNPLGPPGPLLLSGQVLGFGIWGLLGGLLDRPAFRGHGPRLAAAGMVGTLVFQALLNGIFLLFSGIPAWLYFLGVAPYVLLHIASNGALFLVLAPVLQRALAPIRLRLDGPEPAPVPPPA